ncbi:YcnI family protein [Paenalcaligenes niemegkensis]|uniref:YcnI family copper-binding membrane protein n=1 Tax=Paenalcaligenes niemegkensis TaxID=2895469 RepID=UPI001EE7DA08|nr:DUF1775 domain-containing protein [Paenalcaligenes niemegkensis]MCQ9616051.1 YcnI family protein [Paenalcaligenes niemegkensis]
MTIFRSSARFTIALASIFIAPQVFSHVSLETREAPVESRYQAVFRVPHGCQGSPTVKIRVRIPEGVVGVKPQPKAGWTLETVKGDYAQPYTLYGAQVSAGVKEVSWTGGPLLDEHYDEFVFVAYLSSSLEANSTLHFPVVQECQDGVERWIDLPSTEQQATGGDHSDSPAPGLELLPKQ